MDGRFITTEKTVQSVEDLEKLLFLWQEETESHTKENRVSVAEEELQSAEGFTYSKLVIK